MLAVDIVIVHVQTPFGALELGVELAAEYPKAQGLRLAQSVGAQQTLGLQAAGWGGAVAGNCHLGHAVISVSAW